MKNPDGRELVRVCGQNAGGSRTEAGAATGEIDGPVKGLAGWLLRYWRRTATRSAKLAILERISLSPKHTLTLVEAEGSRLLVATSAEGASAFYPIPCSFSSELIHDALPPARMSSGIFIRTARSVSRPRTVKPGRVSW